MWLLLWSILIWFLYSRRDMITKNMKLYDLFRSREKHSNPLIRLNSLISITSQEKLANFVRKDPSKVVKKTALKKLRTRNFSLNSPGIIPPGRFKNSNSKTKR